MVNAYVTVGDRGTTLKTKIFEAGADRSAVVAEVAEYVERAVQQALAYVENPAAVDLPDGVTVVEDDAETVQVVPITITVDSTRSESDN